jgi:hypothetical protein
MTIDATLGLGTLSTEVIEAVVRSSHERDRVPVRIDSQSHSGRCADGRRTQGYIDFIVGARERRPRAYIELDRDHCGPGFNSSRDLADAYRTTGSDIACGLGVIYVGFSGYAGDEAERLLQSWLAVERCLELGAAVGPETDTDDVDVAHDDCESLSHLPSILHE